MYTHTYAHRHTHTHTSSYNHFIGKPRLQRHQVSALWTKHEEKKTHLQPGDDSLEKSCKKQ